MLLNLFALVADVIGCITFFGVDKQELQIKGILDHTRGHPPSPLVREWGFGREERKIALLHDFAHKMI